jgi:hypothetical protein
MSFSKLLKNKEVALVTKNDSAAPAKKEYNVDIKTGLPSFALRLSMLYIKVLFDKVYRFS